MKCCILMGSPRRHGNTAALLEPLTEELTQSGFSCETIWLHDKTLLPCTACRACQKDHTMFGCALKDDMPEIFYRVLACDLLILASPIYSWYCTPPMKAVLERLVYGMNKYYGAVKGPALWAGKPVALVTTCGYRPEHGADLWEAGIKRYCKHSQLTYAGMLAERHINYDVPFMDEQKRQNAQAFAKSLHGLSVASAADK